jgi:hypothetical protein
VRDGVWKKALNRLSAALVAIIVGTSTPWWYTKIQGCGRPIGPNEGNALLPAKPTAQPVPVVQGPPSIQPNHIVTAAPKRAPQKTPPIDQGGESSSNNGTKPQPQPDKEPNPQQVTEPKPPPPIYKPTEDDIVGRTIARLRGGGLTEIQVREYFIDCKGILSVESKSEMEQELADYLDAHREKAGCLKLGKTR